MLSLSIISDDTEYQIKALEFTSKINEKKLSENIDLLSSQIIAILRNIIREHQLKSVQKGGILENLIEKLLKTNEQDDRLEIWDLGLKTFYKKAISKEVLAKNKSYFIELLSSENKYIRWKAWFMVPKLIESGIISKENAMNNKKYFIGLLSRESRLIKLLITIVIPKLIKYGIFTEEELKRYMEGL